MSRPSGTRFPSLASTQLGGLQTSVQSNPLFQLAEKVPPEQRPQQPFIAAIPPQGPSFLDTQACLCAQRSTPANGGQTAWQCIGNQTQGVYTVDTGKWFNAVNPSGQAPGENVPASDSSNPPDFNNALQWDGSQLVPANQDSMSVYDRFCTGRNQTTFSTAFYRVNVDTPPGGTPPLEAVPCFRENALPNLITTPDNWVRQGCNEGFLCMRNSLV
jgi:hypothetical protein